MLDRKDVDDCYFFFQQKTGYEVRLSLVGSEMCIRVLDEYPPMVTCSSGLAK